MPTKRNLLLMGLTAWSLLISPLRVNAQTEVQILDKRCTVVYEENAKFFLQFTILLGAESQESEYAIHTYWASSFAFDFMRSG